MTHSIHIDTQVFASQRLTEVRNQAMGKHVRIGGSKSACLHVTQALEDIQQEKLGAAGRGSAGRLYDDDIVPPVMRKGIAVYEAARALMGLITPHYDEISKARPRPWPG